jgi:dihydrolipoamide dehydrogenase
MANEFDYVVIGAGPGGYSSAIRAAQLGLKTAVIEKENAGGVCLNWGCIPTKALLTSAHLLLKLREGKLGVTAKDGFSADLPAIIDRSRAVAARLETGIKSLFKKYGVRLIQGAGQFTSTNEIRVDGQEKQSVRFRNACIATGASARPLPQLKFSQRVWSYRDALVQKNLPKKLSVIGGGAIGLEFADFYQCLGAEVTLLEMAPHILPNDDARVAVALRRALEQRGMKILEGTKILAAAESAGGVSLEIEYNGQKQNLTSDAALIAIGVTPNTAGIGIENFGILDERGFVHVDANMQTNHKSIFAIGDVTAGKLLAHRAAHQGIFVAEFIAGKNPRPVGEIPGCIYTSPQVATIGRSEEELKRTGREYKAGEFPWLASGMALAAEEKIGFSRVFTDAKTGEILGAQIVGEHAAELIGQVSLAMGSELLADDFLHAVMPHPTLSETVFQAFAVLEGVAVDY